MKIVSFKDFAMRPTENRPPNFAREYSVEKKNVRLKIVKICRKYKKKTQIKELNRVEGITIDSFLQIPLKFS